MRNGPSLTNEHPKNRGNTDNESVEYAMLPVSAQSCFAFAMSASHLARLLKSFRRARRRASGCWMRRKGLACGIEISTQDLGAEFRVVKPPQSFCMPPGRPLRTGHRRLADPQDGQIDYLSNIGLAYTFSTLPPDLPGLDRSFRAKR